MEFIHIYMLVDKRYPLKPSTIEEMFNKKMQADDWNEMCYQLLKLLTKQLKGIKTAKVRINAVKQNLVMSLVLLVQKLLLLVMKVNAAGIIVTTAEGLQSLKG
ncbi:hypothetical protein Tco_0642541 [Tanacetum coccineum]